MSKNLKWFKGQKTALFFNTLVLGFLYLLTKVNLADPVYFFCSTWEIFFR